MKKVTLHFSFSQNHVAQVELKHGYFCALKLSTSTSSPQLRSL